MFKKAIIASLIFSSAVMFTAHTAKAEIDIVKIQQTLKDNTPMDTEQKVGNVLIAYSELMGYLSTDLVSPMADSLKSVLPEVDSLIDRAGTSRDPRVMAALDELRSGVAQVVEGTNSNNTAIQNLSAKVVDLNNAKQKFPDAQFVPTLDLMISLTQEFAVNHANFASDVNSYVKQIDDIKIQILISADTAEAMAKLAQTKQSVEKYSFTEIGDRFKSIETVLKMIYQGR